MDWAGFRFQDPAWLWAAALGPLVLVSAWLRERDRSARAVSFPGAARLLRIGSSWRVRLRHLPLALLEHVPVGIRREHDRAVAELVLDVLECHTLRQEERCRGVPQVVEADVR